MDGAGSEPTYVLNGREALTPVFADLNRYEATTHFNGQSTVRPDGEHATGESYTIAHHLYTEDGSRKIMIASLRYTLGSRITRGSGDWDMCSRSAALPPEPSVPTILALPGDRCQSAGLLDASPVRLVSKVDSSCERWLEQTLRASSRSSHDTEVPGNRRARKPRDVGRCTALEGRGFRERSNDSRGLRLNAQQMCANGLT
jgi:hypothetical protein